MGKLQTFFHVFQKTFTSPSYYKELLKMPLGFSLKFFWAYFFFYALVATILVGYQALIPLHNFLTKELPTKVAEVYPSELEVRIKDGKVTTNVEEPYVIPIDVLDKDLGDVVPEDDEHKIENLLVIDTSASIEDFYDYKTAILLTKEHLSMIDDDGTIQTVSLEDIGDVTISKTKVTEWMKEITPYLAFIAPTLAVLMFIGILLFVPLKKMLYVVFLAIVLWIVSKIMSQSLTYKQAYQMGLHLVVISTTVFGLLSIASINPSFPFLQTILLTVFAAVIMSQWKNKQPAEQAQATPTQG